MSHPKKQQRNFMKVENSSFLFYHKFFQFFCSSNPVYGSGSVIAISIKPRTGSGTSEDGSVKLNLLKIFIFRSTVRNEIILSPFHVCQAFRCNDDRKAFFLSLIFTGTFTLPTYGSDTEHDYLWQNW